MCVSRPELQASGPNRLSLTGILNLVCSKLGPCFDFASHPWPCIHPTASPRPLSLRLGVINSWISVSFSIQIPAITQFCGFILFCFASLWGSRYWTQGSTEPCPSLFVLFWNWISLSCLRWPQTCSPPVSVSWLFPLSKYVRLILSHPPSPEIPSPVKIAVICLLEPLRQPCLHHALFFT